MENILFRIDKQSIVFLMQTDQKIILDIGYQTIIDRHFKYNLPTDYEVEMAIMTIEDELQKLASKWQKVASVFGKKSDFADIAKFIGDDKVIQQNDLEKGFNRVADIIMGSPKQLNEFPDDNEFVSKLLIVREVMHHLDIERIDLQ